MSNEKAGFKLTNCIGGEKLVLMAAIVVVVIIFTILNKNFFSWANFVNILLGASLVGIVAIGHTYLIIAHQNDLSPGSLAALSGVVAALLVSWGMPFVLALLVTILVGVGVGLFNAWMITKIKLEAFIATLVTQAIIRGFAFIVCGGRAIAISDPVFIGVGKANLFGINIAVWVTVVCILLFGFILAKTKFGRSVYAIGGSTDAARLAGLNPDRIVCISFMIMGVLCAIGGVIFAARMNSGQPSSGVNLEFDAITAVILGGVSFAGGVGSMGGTVLGILLIQSFNTGLIMVNIPTFWQYVARGGLLLFALTSDFIRKRNREKDLLATSMKNA